MRPAPALAALLLAAWLGQALAQPAAPSVALTGVLGQRALLVVDGAGPRSVAIGETWRGVKLLALQGEQAELDIGGHRTSVRLGGSPVAMGAPAANRRIVLQADGRGHFMGQGRINGQLVQFMVDTGASTVAMDTSEAERLGLDFRKGRQVSMGTANGATLVWVVRLASLRIGETELRDIEAAVLPQPMPYVLLGNNVLARFQMSRGPQQMVLEQRY
ncbi:TIGR02281 family clan AA aspartic protease [Pseudorhodoferax sp. Leaf274]|uniref:retropepsin-like aspartic protease family protein n=1 Tax=Pseudorhodoferax sp. Leaf274 TaxID=1736318 RepID=UPI001F2351C1|nr:retropepsin-like aspartic protease [Pseudorhodoferax sp. Leaf274]